MSIFLPPRPAYATTDAAPDGENPFGRKPQKTIVILSRKDSYFLQKT